MIAPLPEGWGLCQSCELMLASAGLEQSPTRRGLDELPPDWQADFQRLSALLIRLSNHYVGRAQFHVYDPRSLPGLVRAIRFAVRRYPTFVVGGRQKVTGWDEEALAHALQTAIAAAEGSHGT